MNQETSGYIWPIKYRPQNIAGMILPAPLRNYFNKIIETKNVPNLLLYSASPGPGKTSVAKALCSDLKISFTYVNTSMERNLDVLRTDIERFATTMSVEGGLKVAILDEFDGASGILQKALRALIEDVSGACRFILTCNNLSKIHDAIKSRCELIDFNFQDDKVKLDMKRQINKRLTGILKYENVPYNSNVISGLVDTHYPDIRYMIKLLQQYSVMNGNINDDIFTFKKAEEQLFKLMCDKKITLARQFIMDKGYNYDELYRSLYDGFVPKLSTKQKQGQAILLIDEYMRGSAISFDKEITFTACMLRLIELV